MSKTQQITFETKSGTFQIEATGDNGSILFEGLAAGLSLPYECATGTCGTCRARAMSSDVEPGWPEAPGARRLKRERGDILMCQARAAGDCTVRVPAVVTESAAEPAPVRHNGVIDMVERLTPDVIHFEVALSQPTAFAAGQFMVIEAPGVTGGRALSMVNYAPQTDRLAFVAKRKPGGRFSDWLFEAEAADAAISLFGPLGKATFRPETDGDLICVTGGSGIAGIMSILDHAVKSGHFSRHRGELYFGVRTLADGFYIDALAELATRAEGALRITLALSDAAPAAEHHPSSNHIALAPGFVHDVAAAALRARAEPFDAEAVGFVAGPPPMVDGALRVLLGDGKLPPGQIRYDKFA